MKTYNTLIAFMAISISFMIAGCPQANSGNSKISGDITTVEFEKITSAKTSADIELQIDKDDLYPWANGKGVIISAPRSSQFITYELTVDDDTPRNIKITGFKDTQFGRYRMGVNNRTTGKVIDFYGRRGQTVDAFDIGTYKPVDGKITITFALVGSDPKSTGKRYGAAIDYMVLTKDTTSPAY